MIFCRVQSLFEGYRENYPFLLQDYFKPPYCSRGKLEYIFLKIISISLLIFLQYIICPLIITALFLSGFYLASLIISIFWVFYIIFLLFKLINGSRKNKFFKIIKKIDIIRKRVSFKSSLLNLESIYNDLYKIRNKFYFDTLLGFFKKIIIH